MLKTVENAETTNSPEVSVIGDGEVGAKARELIEKTPVLRELGFCTPPELFLLRVSLMTSFN